MGKSELKHRERINLALEHQETDRIPIAIIGSRINTPAHMELGQYLRDTRNISVDDYLKPLLDIKHIEPKYIGAKLEKDEDFWGVKRKPVSYGPDSYDEIEYYPMAAMDKLAQITNYRWPNTGMFDYSVIGEMVKQISATEHYCLVVSGGTIFETAWSMRGFEQALTDLALNPEFIDLIMEKVTEFYSAHTKKQLEAADGKIDLVFTGDDIGGQQSLLMSLDLFRKHIKPYHERLNKIIHSFGAKVIYHTDGAVMAAVGDLVDMGIDVLQALQFDAKDMDPVVLKRTYGQRLCFEGGISVQRTLPFGTADEVKQEVIDRIKVLGKKGGYILGPSHAIQAGTPPENIVAMFDTARSWKMK
jgi:uroporphyrinogen decarboxylase